MKKIDLSGVLAIGRAKGGIARKDKLSEMERSSIAKKAAAARWDPNLPQATHPGVLKIGGSDFPCAVLSDGSRVLTETDFMSEMGIYRSGALSKRRTSPDGGARPPLYLAFKNLEPFIPKHLGELHLAPLKYRTLSGGIAHGVRAEAIPKICEVWLDARAAGGLGPRQEQIAAKAEMLLRGLAHVGIIALVDEATGYQEVREREALQAILDAYLLKEFAAWAKRFPDEFYREIFRLRGWDWRGMRVNRPQVVAHYTNDIVYDRLAPGITEQLRKRNPVVATGRRRSKHHQWLTGDVGHPALSQHLHAVMGLMRASDSWKQFRNMLDRAYPKRGDTLMLPLTYDDED